LKTEEVDNCASLFQILTPRSTRSPPSAIYATGETVHLLYKRFVHYVAPFLCREQVYQRQVHTALDDKQAGENEPCARRRGQPSGQQRRTSPDKASYGPLGCTSISFLGQKSYLFRFSLHTSRVSNVAISIILWFPESGACPGSSCLHRLPFLVKTGIGL